MTKMKEIQKTEQVLLECQQLLDLVQTSEGMRGVSHLSVTNLKSSIQKRIDAPTCDWYFYEDATKLECSSEVAGKTTSGLDIMHRLCMALCKLDAASDLVKAMNASSKDVECLGAAALDVAIVSAQAKGLALPPTVHLTLT